MGRRTRLSRTTYAGYASVTAVSLIVAGAVAFMSTRDDSPITVDNQGQNALVPVEVVPSPVGTPNNADHLGVGSPPANPVAPAESAKPTPSSTASRVPAAPLPQPVATTTVYEAESPVNTRDGSSVYSCTACSGGQRVGDIGSGSDRGSLQFNNVHAATAGSVTLTMTWTNDDSSSRVAKLSVNGTLVASYSLGVTSNWDTPRSGTVTINLKAGDNTLKFFNDTGPAPSFDKITVTVPFR